MEAVKLAEVERDLAREEDPLAHAIVSAPPAESSRVVAVKRWGHAEHDFELGIDLATDLDLDDVQPAIEVGTASDAVPIDMAQAAEPEPFSDPDPYGGLIPLDEPADPDPFGGLIPLDEGAADRGADVEGAPLRPASPELPGVVDASLGRVPRLVVSPSELTKLPMDPRGAFLLGNVDGMSSLEEILDMSPIPRDEALALVDGLERLGVIAFS